MISSAPGLRRPPRTRHTVPAGIRTGNGVIHQVPAPAGQSVHEMPAGVDDLWTTDCGRTQEDHAVQDPDPRGARASRECRRQTDRAADLLTAGIRSHAGELIQGPLTWSRLQAVGWINPDGEYPAQGVRRHHGRPDPPASTDSSAGRDLRQCGCSRRYCHGWPQGVPAVSRGSTRRLGRAPCPSRSAGALRPCGDGPRPMRIDLGARRPPGIDRARKAGRWVRMSSGSG